MRVLLSALLTSVLALVAIGAVRLVGQEAPRGGGPVRLGVVDLEAVFEASEQRRTLEKEIYDEFDLRITALEELKAEIQKLRQSMALVKEGSEEHARFQEEVTIKGARLELLDKRFQAELQKQRTASFERVYGTIRGEVEKVAGELGVDLVLQRSLTLQESMPSWESVLFAASHLDITRQVIERVNGK